MHERNLLPREAEGSMRGPALPALSDAEREFWRRAVAIERARRRCGRPAPFPFQEA